MSAIPPPMPMEIQPAPAQRKKAAGLALAAMILGLCGLIPGLGILCGLTGLALGIVALAVGTSRKGMAIAGVVLGLLLPAAQIAIAVPGLARARELAKRVSCGTNLHAIGRGVKMYQSEYNDAYPSDLDMLVNMKYLSSPRCFQCPAAESGRPCDYFYLPALPTDPGSTLVACDLTPANHRREGRQVLDADSSVQWRSEPDFQAELARPQNARFGAALRAAEGKLAPR